MRRYYFHLWTGAGHQFDGEGSELESADAAYLEAFGAAQVVAADLIRRRAVVGAHRFDVTGPDGRLLFELPFSEVLGHRSTPTNAQVRHGLALVAEVTRQISRVKRSLEESRALISQLHAGEVAKQR